MERRRKAETAQDKRTMGHRSQFRKRQQSQMRRRRRINAHAVTIATHEDFKEHTGMRITPRDRNGHAIVRKDRPYYRRTGALWTDLVHCPDTRVSLVADPRIVVKDQVRDGNGRGRQLGVVCVYTR